MGVTYICESCDSETEDRAEFLRHTTLEHQVPDPGAIELADRAERGAMLCPFCREEIKIEAVVCPHCQRRFTTHHPDGSWKPPRWAVIAVGFMVAVVMAIVLVHNIDSSQHKANKQSDQCLRDIFNGPPNGPLPKSCPGP